MKTALSFKVSNKSDFKKVFSLLRSNNPTEYNRYGSDRDGYAYSCGCEYDCNCASPYGYNEFIFKSNGKNQLNVIIKHS